MLRFALVLFLGSWLLLYSLPRTSDAQDLRIDEEISPTLADRFLNELSPDVSVITIRSHGGHELSALRIARAIESLNIAIEVDGYCYSACASILLPAASEVRIDAEDIIALHGDSNSILRIPGFIQQDNPNLAEQKLAAQETRSFYEGQDADINWLFEALYVIEPICYHIDIRSQRGRLETKYNLWIPPMSVLSAIGIEFSTNSEYFGNQFLENRPSVYSYGGRLFRTGFGRRTRYPYGVGKCE